MFNLQRAKISDLFSSSTQFQIPHYQRDYKWGKDEAQELIEDLQNYVSSDDATLFLGTIILQEDKHSKSHGKKHTMVVDGQQRITTMLILLLACRQQAIVLKDDKLAQTILSQIAYIDKTTGDSHGPLLVASESIRDIINHISHSNWDGDFPTKIKTKHVKRQVNRVKPVFNVFAKTIADYNKKRLSELLNAVYNSTVIRIDITDEEEALSIFERTNARGMELEISDLLKNYLFAKKVDDIKDRWDDIVERAEGTFVRMLKYYYVSRRGYVQKAQLYRQLKAYANAVTPNAMTEELARFSEFYQVTRKPDKKNVRDFFQARGLTVISEHEEHSDSICRSLQALNEFKVTQFVPPAYAIISAIEDLKGPSRAAAEKALVRLFVAFEKLHFCNNIVCERVGNEVERFYADICTQFEAADDLLRAINLFIQQMREKRATREEFLSRFAEITYSNNERSIITYAFDRLMNADLKGSQRLEVYNPNPAIKQRNSNIEHFMPVNGTSSKEFDKEVLDNIGNLLIISKQTNSSLGNLSPMEKIERLKSTNAKEIQNSVYVLQFVEEYGPYARDWNKDMIHDRARRMAEEAYDKVWHFQ
jgi:hypothetical protein